MEDLESENRLNDFSLLQFFGKFTSAKIPFQIDLFQNNFVVSKGRKMSEKTC